MQAKGSYFHLNIHSFCIDHLNKQKQKKINSTHFGTAQNGYASCMCACMRLHFSTVSIKLCFFCYGSKGDNLLLLVLKHLDDE